ncbi:TonB-dependent receptor [Erythrobacter sp. T5W1-R]|uniref:TonB-dependent receptor n=1 Tax=Erythrobacter sp. T5W1-R TaxID=3101752 RepID=UPI002AFFB7E9|nr:TonB-dependent receptor [Erythrobacter sp. T5W1-R]MEA1619381.1 TonB-dependent receptor [Erythrobacter sp. T5W1-R]
MGLRAISANARLLCGAATGIALMASAMPAAAQSTSEPEAQVDEQGTDITVTGIRSSIESALGAKRNATSIVEVIASEDLGLLPDLSIADSLARLPGVTAQRVRGRSQQISIRGLGPDFSLALLNGREVVSAGNNRGIEFDQFPSELVGSAIVYKTGDAQLASIGIAGAVDLRTVKPLDYKDRQISVSATYSRNDQGTLNPDFPADGYRFFASYIDQNKDGTLGWSLGATLQSNPTQFVTRELKSNQFQTARTPAGLIYPADNPRQGAVSRDFQRLSVAGALQFEPSDKVALNIDAFYTDTKDSGVFRGTETPIASWSGAQFEGATGAGPFADTATYSGVVPILRTDTEGTESQIFAIGSNLDFMVTDNLGFMVDYGYSTLNRDDIDYESYAGTGRARSGAQDRLTFTMPRSGEYSIAGQLDYTNPANVLLTDPGGWGQVGFIKQPQIEDELHQLRAEARWEFDGGILKDIRAGWLYTDRTKSFDSNESFLRPSNRFVNGSLAIPASAIIGRTNTRSLGQNILAYDPSSFLTDGTYLVEKGTFDTQWVVSEQIHNFYLQANIDGDLGSVPVRGNIGLRYADTSQSSTGTIAGGVNTVDFSYGNWLPSANLAFEVAPDTFIRIAAAQTVTRARLDQMAANQNIGFNPQSCVDTNGDQRPDTVVGFNPPQLVCFTLGGGNPFLQPYISTSFDISFEKYFGPASAIIIAGFHKQLDDWIIDFNEVRDLTQPINNAGFGGILTNNPQLSTGTFGGPVNFADGKITGIEGTVRANFGDFTRTLDGFGGLFSVTYVDAQVTRPGGTINIPGYSDVTWSADVFYEKNGWRSRVNARYRSGFLAEVQSFDGSLFGAQAQPETQIDAQIGYTFQNQSGPLKGLTVLVEGANLTNAPFVTENDLFNGAGALVGTFPSQFDQYGRTFNFTIRKNF